jgi:site-specific DNA-methyltransferase (adenine-specific)
MPEITLFQGDCLQEMEGIPDGTIDMVLCDLPYESECEWDRMIPFEPLWKQYRRIVKKNGAMVFTACQPFTTRLINSQYKLFRYSLVWKKSKKVGFLNARKMPLRTHEDILVFYRKLPTYNPQGVQPFRRKQKRSSKDSNAYKFRDRPDHVQTLTNYPGSVLEISSENSVYHPTQKPVALMEYLIQTYTNPGDLVLDNCMGSGSTGVACSNTGRRFVGIEKDEKFFKIAQERISRAQEGE